MRRLRGVDDVSKTVDVLENLGEVDAAAEGNDRIFITTLKKELTRL